MATSSSNAPPSPLPSPPAQVTDREFRTIRATDEIFTTPGRFSCYHLSVGVSDALNGAQVIDCALCNNVRHSPVQKLLGGEEGKRAGRSHIIVMHSDDHPYYGPNTILRIKCAKDVIHQEKCTCSNPCIPPRKPCGTGCCSQYYYATIADLKNCVRPDGQFVGVANCRTMHQSAQYPIYKCLVALEILTGMRWDFPIPCPGGCRAAYNPIMRTVIICFRNGDDLLEQRARVFPAFNHIPNMQIIEIPASDVDDWWPGDGLCSNMQRELMVRKLTFPYLWTLIDHLAQKIHFTGPTRLANSAFCQMLLQSMIQGRILVDEKHANPPIATPQPRGQICHYLDNTFMRSGVSGYPPEGEECLANLRKKKEITEEREKELREFLIRSASK